MSEERRCLNCDTSLAGRFCSGCGQKDVDPERGLFSIVAELVGEAFEADGRLAKTVVPFLLRPGEVAAEWVDGKRARFTSPARIFVFALFVGFLGIAFAAESTVEMVPDTEVKGEDGDVLIGWSDENDNGFHIDLSGIEDFQGTEREVAQFFVSEMLEAAPKVALLLVPVFAMLLQLVLWRFAAMRHLVFSLNLHSRLLIFSGVALVLPFRGPGWISFVALHGYLLLGLKRVYDLTWWQTLWRYALLAGAWLFLWVGSLIVLFAWAAWRMDL